MIGEIAMTKKQMIVKGNDLIGATYSLGVAEQRLIFLAIIEAREQNKLIDVGKPLRIYAKRYEQQFSVEKHTSYEAMKRAVNGLYEAGFSYTNTDEASGKQITYKSRWVEKIGYADDLGCVELIFASDVIPLITRLDSCYTEFDLKQVSSLQSEYAIRLYELMMQWRRTGKVPKIELKDLRDKLGVEVDQYKDMNNFKGRVLDHAVKQINEFTDITVKYEQHKTGRKVTGFTFTFRQKKVIEHVAPNNANAFLKLTDAQINLFSSKLAALPELGSNAPIGKSTAEFAAIIASDLADEDKQLRYMPYLEKLGYRPEKRK